MQSQPEWLVVVLTCLRLAISIFATADILLRKSDVRAAFGWIAAVWLSPIIGGTLYYMFGINRVTRRASRLSKAKSRTGRGDGLSLPGLPANVAELSRISQRVTATALSAGNNVMALHGGDEAFPQMLQAIAESRKSVALTSYIFRNDTTGGEFVDALIAAHRRGVEVRVLLDSIGAGYFFPKIMRRLLAEGVVADQFLHTWIPWRMPFLNMRSHRKILVCDGAVGFTGGMNIGDEYAASRAKAQRVNDTHFRLEGLVVSQLMDTFAQDWEFTTGEELSGPLWWPDLSAKGSVHARGIRSGPDADIYKIETLLGAMLSQARKRVRIVTPYFLPSQSLQFAIMEALLREVRVEIILPEKCDIRFLDWAMRGHLRNFRYIPADFYFTPPPFDHSKLITMDDEWTLFGSSNWDIRSHRLNFEFDLECYDAGLAADVNAAIDARIAVAQKFDPVDIMSWSKPIQVRNAAAHLLLPYL
jgi:cardiolipin synthase